MGSDPVADAMSAAAGNYAPQSGDPVGDAMSAAARGESTTNAIPGFKVAPDWLKAEDRPLQGMGTVAVQTAGQILNAPGKALTGAAVKAGITNPYAAAAIGVIPDLAEDFLLGGRKPKLTAPPAEIAPHPLLDAATQEQARLEAMNAKATEAGINLPEKELSGPQHVVNDLARDDLKLPRATQNGPTPLTPNMLAAGRKQNVSPAYQAISSLPEPIQISPTTRATIDDVSSMLPKKLAATLPTGNTMTGQQAVEFSKILRARANQLDMPGANAAGDLWSDVSQAHRDAAHAIEDDVTNHLTANGQGDLATAWDAARRYNAKSYAYQSALDGAGNVRVPDLKRQLKNDVPLSDNAELIANIGASHPELFSGAPARPVEPGIVRKAAAKVAPAAGAVIGSHFGPLGTILGTATGENIGERILKP